MDIDSPTAAPKNVQISGSMSTPARRKPGPQPGVLKRPGLARTHRTIKRLWADGGYRNRLKALVPDQLPLAVNRVERATIRSWLEGAYPRPTGFH